MKKIISLLLVLVIVLGLCACSKNEQAAEQPQQQTFSVGFAKGDITPSTSSLLAGYGDFFDDEPRMSTTVLDPIYATCIAFTDSTGKTVLLFGLDLLYIDASLFEVIRKSISDENGIPTSHILFSASHTHSAPTQSAKNANSNDVILKTCIRIAKHALEDRKPAQMFTTFTRPERMSFVRHYIQSNGNFLGKGVDNIPKDQLIGHMHKADNLLQLVKFTREGGKDVILTNWQAHYKGADQVDYNGISGDYVSLYRSALEDSLNCHAAFVLGGSGNLTSSSKMTGETLTKQYTDHGQKLAEIATEAAANFQPAELGNIYLKEEIIKIPGGKNADINNYLYALGFGDFGCAFAPFEIFDTNAKAVREASNWKYTFYASCSYGSAGNGYLPDKLAFTYNAYEAYGPKEVDYTYTKYPEGTAELIQDKLITMLNDIFTESGNEKKEREEGYNLVLVPATNGKEYTNMDPGNAGAITEGERGFYCTKLIEDGNAIKNVLIASKEVADQIAQKTTMKLIFDDRNIVVGIAQ